MSEFDDLYGEWASSSVDVETLLGKGALGDNYSARENVTGVMIQDGGQTFVRNAAGEQELSTCTLYMNEGNVDKFTPGSKVFLVDRQTLVITTAKLDAYGLIDHLKVNLQ